MRIITANILNRELNFDDRIPHSIDFFVSRGADIILLQEVPSDCERLMSYLFAKYKYGWCQRNTTVNGRKHTVGIAWNKITISDSMRITKIGGVDALAFDGYLQTGHEQDEEQRFIVISYHGKWGAHAQSYRLTELHTINTWVEQTLDKDSYYRDVDLNNTEFEPDINVPVFLGGDFNAPDTELGIQYMLGNMPYNDPLKYDDWTYWIEAQNELLALQKGYPSAPVSTTITSGEGSRTARGHGITPSYCPERRIDYIMSYGYNHGKQQGFSRIDIIAKPELSDHAFLIAETIGLNAWEYQGNVDEVLRDFSFSTHHNQTIDSITLPKPESANNDAPARPAQPSEPKHHKTLSTTRINASTMHTAHNVNNAHTVDNDNTAGTVDNAHTVDNAGTVDTNDDPLTVSLYDETVSTALMDNPVYVIDSNSGDHAIAVMNPWGVPVRATGYDGTVSSTMDGEAWILAMTDENWQETEPQTRIIIPRDIYESAFTITPVDTNVNNANTDGTVNTVDNEHTVDTAGTVDDEYTVDNVGSAFHAGTVDSLPVPVEPVSDAPSSPGIKHVSGSTNGDEPVVDADDLKQQMSLHKSVTGDDSVPTIGRDGD